LNLFELVARCYCYTDGVVNVHDLTVFAPITSLEKARGATMFVLDLQVKYRIFEVFS